MKNPPKAEGSSEHDIVSVAIKQLPTDIRERLMKLFDEGLLKDNDLDLRSITVFASLNEGLQARVMNYLENERIYVANARSKSGFLIATCDKAKTGCLDARGLGAIDPWRQALSAMATPKMKIFDLENEKDWIDKHGDEPIKLTVNTAICESEIETAEVTVEVPLSESSAVVKAKLVAMGLKSKPPSQMKLWVDPVGFLKDRHSLAYYNIIEDCELVLSFSSRGGRKTRKDHTVPVKRPKTHEKVTGDNPTQSLSKKKESVAKSSAIPMPKPGQPLSPKSFAAAVAAMKAGGPPPALPSMPTLPGMPGMSMPLPGMPGLGGAAPGAGPPGLPGLPSLPGMPKLPALPGLSPGGTAPVPGLPSLPGMPKIPGLGLPGMSAPAGGLGGLSGPAGLSGLLGGLSGPAGGLGGLPGMPKLGGLPGLDGLGAAAAPKMSTGPPPGLAALLGSEGGATPKLPGLDPGAVLSKAGLGIPGPKMAMPPGLAGLGVAGATAKASGPM